MRLRKLSYFSPPTTAAMVREQDCSRMADSCCGKFLPDLRLLARFCKPATTSGDCHLLCRRTPCAAPEVSRLARASRIEERTRGTLHHPVAFLDAGRAC